MNGSTDPGLHNPPLHPPQRLLGRRQIPHNLVPRAAHTLPVNGPLRPPPRLPPVQLRPDLRHGHALPLPHADVYCVSGADLDRGDLCVFGVHVYADELLPRRDCAQGRYALAQ